MTEVYTISKKTGMPVASMSLEDFTPREVKDLVAGKVVKGTRYNFQRADDYKKARLTK